MLSFLLWTMQSEATSLSMLSCWKVTWLWRCVELWLFCCLLVTCFRNRPRKEKRTEKEAKAKQLGGCRQPTVGRDDVWIKRRINCLDSDRIKVNVYSRSFRVGVKTDNLTPDVMRIHVKFQQQSITRCMLLWLKSMSANCTHAML